MKADESGDTLPRVKSFTGASTVSVVMKAMAILILLAAIATAVAIARDHADFTNQDDRLALAVGVVFGSIPVAALWAWFGYVLDVLLESYWLRAASGDED